MKTVIAIAALLLISACGSNKMQVVVTDPATGLQGIYTECTQTTSSVFKKDRQIICE